ncbi:MAG: ribosome rescue protein RqcH [Candidatus Bathyarchaeia archaeon]|nr:ribosome rescue protein RqcH [Candidatus Bathyarchaeia archaeon]
MRRKKEFTNFDVAAVVRELRGAILDSHVNNVYQLDAKTLLFKLRKADKPVFQLVFEAGKLLHLTSYTAEKPMVPPAFCMALRKYLRNGWLVNIEQHGFERVVVFTFKTKTGTIRLVLELFGDGNIILVGEDGMILHALSYKRMRDRNILRGEAFRFAPSSGRNPLKVDKEEMLEELRNFGDVDVVRALARFLSIGGVYAEEVLLRAGVDKKKPCNALSDSEVCAIFDCLHVLLSQVTSGSLEPCIVLDEAEGFVDVVPMRLRRYDGFKHQPYSSFNEALDEFYARVAVLERAVAAVEAEGLKGEADRLKRIIASQEKVLVEAETKAERDKHIGDVIYAYTNELQALLERFSAGKRSGKEWSRIVSEVLAEKKAGLRSSVFFESFDVKRLVVNVCVDGLRFGLDLRRDLFANASRFYERSKRAKRKLKGAKAALEKSRKKLAEVEAKLKMAKTLEKVKPAKALEELAERKIKPKKWFEKFRWFVSSEGGLVVAGKDAVSNEVLIKKYTEAGDVVFHADVVGAPFVAVKTGGKKPSEQVLREASEFAAAFSRGWREGFASVDVYWVKPEQLSKGGPSGEYVPRGAFVVRGRRNWLRGVSLRIAIGVVVEDGEFRFVGGSVDAVKAKTNVYVIVVPGNLSGKDLFRRVLAVLAGKLPKELRERVLKVSVEEIREYIPYNKARILED